MTPFRLILDSSGLSVREAAVWLNVSHNSAESWAAGRRTVPEGVMAEMLDLIDRQGRAAEEALATILGAAQDQGELPELIELGLASDDHEAQGLGWPTASAHAAVMRRLIEIAPDDVRESIVLVPRGSTVATAAAEI